MNTTKRLLSLFLLALFVVGSTNLWAAPDDDEDGGDSSRDALSTDLIAIPPTLGKGDGQYFELRSSGAGGGISTVLNADVRLALEKLDEDGDTLKVLNTHLGITTENYQDAVITLFTGTDEDGDGTCLTEGPDSICVLEGGGSHDLEVNLDDVLHAAWAMALRTEDDQLKGSGICWTNFESVTVEPQFDDNGNMTSIKFFIEGGEEGMPEIAEDDGSMVGFGADWLGFSADVDCGPDTVCEIIPIMMGVWDD